MSKVIANSMSLDGFVADPGDGQAPDGAASTSGRVPRSAKGRRFR
jgi:hypothetical protein